MPHVSRNKLSKKIEDELIKNVELVLTSTNTKEEMQGFLSALITPTEKLMLAKRLAVIILLTEGLPEAQIAEMLHVTRITVAKLQLFYEARGKGFDIGIKKLKEAKQFDSFKRFLLSLARYSIRAAGGYVKPTVLD